MRVADEARWRGQSAVAAALVVGLYWGAAWLVGETIELTRTIVAFAAVAIPTFAYASVGAVRRIRDAVMRATPPPRASVHETAASSRERRMRLSGIVLTGIIALLIFERFTDTGGVLAGLIAGLLLALGIADWRESHLWEAAERERETRIFVLVRASALTPRLGIREVYEAPRPGRAGDHVYEPSPFDLEI